MTTYPVKNLDCADCAARIEKKINSLTSVRYASLNFASASLTLETDDLAAVREAVRGIEPAVEIGGGERETGSAQEDRAARREPAVIILLSAAYAAGFFLPDSLAPWLFVAVWLASGYRVLRTAVTNIRRGRVFDENFLMSAATIGAIAIGAYSEAGGVMLFYRVGEYLESLSLEKSRKSIKALLALKPDYAEVRRDGRIVRVRPEAVAVGETVVVRPGERIPLDGRVREGVSWIDTAAVTGESVPRPASPGTEVPAGCINGTGMLTVQVVREYGESSAARILGLVEEAASRKSKTERFMTRFAGYYTPAVIAAAVLTALVPPLLFPEESFRVWLYRALVVLVISCPCALVVSIPLGYFGGIGGAARRGILIKGSNFIDVLARVRTVVFDKTGTLTKGSFSVIGIHPRADGAGPGAHVPGDAEQELLFLASRAEAGSNHPIARSLRDASGGNPAPPESFEEIPGGGVRAVVDGRSVLAGSEAFLRAGGIYFTVAGGDTGGANAGGPTVVESAADDAAWGSPAGVAVHVAADGLYLGRIDIGDEIRPGTAAAMQGLRRRGIRNLVMLSGDTRERAGRFGRAVGIDDVRGGLLPEEKAAALEEIIRLGPGRVAFVGDGINDAPVLTGADVGIAMGGIGQDAAVETADVVILDDDPRKVVSAIEISVRTRRIVAQNIFLALGVKLFFVAGGVSGLAGMWEAVFADVGVAVLAVLNSMRAMKTPPEA